MEDTETGAEAASPTLEDKCHLPTWLPYLGNKRAPHSQLLIRKDSSLYLVQVVDFGFYRHHSRHLPGGAWCLSVQWMPGEHLAVGSVKLAWKPDTNPFSSS
jgi:hypothetical protein